MSQTLKVVDVGRVTRKPKLLRWLTAGVLVGLALGLAAGGAAGFMLGKLYQDKDDSAGPVAAVALDVIGTQKPTTPTRCKALCKRVRDFHGTFEQAASTHDSIRLEQTSPWITVDGYVVKTSDDGRRIAQLLKDGKKHLLELDVQYPDPEADEVLITRVFGPAQ